MRRHLGLTQSEGICKRFDYIPIRIESAKKTLKAETARAGSDNGLRFIFIFEEKMVPDSYKTGSVGKP